METLGESMTPTSTTKSWPSATSLLTPSVAVELHRESVKVAPAYDSSADLNRQSESGLYTHYARPNCCKANSMLGHQF